MKRFRRFRSSDEYDVPAPPPNMAAMFGKDGECHCGHVEMYHNNFKGEDGRCTVYQCGCRRYEKKEKAA